MTAAYFEDHPTDPDKVILRKPKHDFNDSEMAMSWRKRQMIIHQLERNVRNETLEEVAKEVEKMTAFGPDTIASFAIFIREMKR